MKVDRFFAFQTKPQVFARLENGLIVHIVSGGELADERAKNPDAETEKFSDPVYEQIASSARALGYKV